MNASSHTTSTQLISIIVPLYNQEQFITTCLKSILHQSYPHLEVIVINDGSTDSSQDVVEKFAADDERIVLINQENKGVSAARNAGLERATGDFIMFVDADDWLDLTCVQEALATWTMASNDEEELVAVRFGHFQDDEEVLPTQSPTDAKESFIELLSSYDRCASSIWSLLIPAEAITRPGLRFHEELSRSEDVLFLAQLYLSGCGLFYLPVSMYHYRLGRGLGSGVYPDALSKADIFYETILHTDPSAFALKGKAHEALIHYVARFYMLSMAIEAHVAGNYKDVIKAALESSDIESVMKAAMNLPDFPLWARMLAQSIYHKRPLQVRFFLTSIEKKLLS